MCLESVDVSDFNKRSRIAYKLFYTSRSGYMSLFRDGEPFYKTGRRYTAHNEEIQSGYTSPYTCGFHAFVNKSDAIDYANRVYPGDIICVKKVKLEKVRILGTDKYSDCYVADKMTILPGKVK